MTLFSRTLPNAFSRIPLRLGQGAGLWLDVESGHLCWNLTEIVQQRPIEARSVTDSHVRVPLPREVADALVARLPAHHDAQTLADLFPPCLAPLGVRVKKFLRSVALTSHRPTAKRLSNSMGRFVLAISRDETIASIIGIDFTLGTSANFNYSVIAGERVIDSVRKIYQALGFSGTVCDALLPTVGSALAPSHNLAAALIVGSMTRIAREIDGVPRRCSARALFRQHNAISTLTYLIVFFVSGHRPTIEATLTGNGIDHHSGLFLQTDKRTSPYHESRVGVLPATIRHLLRPGQS